MLVKVGWLLSLHVDADVNNGIGLPFAVWGVMIFKVFAA